jgi:hypothetical protein
MYDQIVFTERVPIGGNSKVVYDFISTIIASGFEACLIKVAAAIHINKLSS